MIRPPLIVDNKAVPTSTGDLAASYAVELAVTNRSWKPGYVSLVSEDAMSAQAPDYDLRKVMLSTERIGPYGEGKLNLRVDVLYDRKWVVDVAKSGKLRTKNIRFKFQDDKGRAIQDSTGAPAFLDLGMEVWL